VQLKEIPVQGTFELKNKAMDVLVTVSTYVLARYCNSLVLKNRSSAVSVGTAYRLNDPEVGVRVPVISKLLTSPYRPDLM
jgi:hypothetical protein